MGLEDFSFTRDSKKDSAQGLFDITYEMNGL